MQLDGTRIRTWRKLDEAFVEHYRYNSDMVLTRTQLHNLSLKHNESFKEYAQMWRDMAARVQPPMMER